MEDYFEIPVIYNGQERAFTSRLLMTGYTHKIEVEVDGQLILSEPDEDQNYRAIVNQANLERGLKLDTGLLRAIAEVIESTKK